MTVNWRKANNVSGYQIQYSTDSNFKKNNTITMNTQKKNSTTIKALTTGNTYYVRIRTYTSHNEKNFYSSYSDAVEIEIN